MLNTLNVSHTGLNAAKIAVENVSNNIANENTPGYKKRVVQLSELEQMDSRFTGRGVNASSSYRITSQYMYDKLISENTKSNYYDKMSNMMGSVESIFAETEDSGFSAELNRYFQAVENLRTSPNSELYKTTLKNAGTTIVESLQNIYKSIENQQVSEKNELKVNVGKVNSILKEIGEVNVKLEKFGTSNNDLLDKRDQLELELSSYVDISVDRNNEYYELKVAGEVAISNNTNVRTFEVLENKTNQVDKFYNQKFDSKGEFEIIDPLKFESDNVTAKTYALGDKITYKLNNEIEVSVTIGEIIPDTTKPKVAGVHPPLDINGDGNPAVSEDEIVRALVFKINNSKETQGLVTAYNGDYSIDASGNKITNDSVDQYLRIESKNSGTESQFEGRLSVEKNLTPPNTPADRTGEVLFKNENVSKDAETNVSVGILGKEISLKSGIIKAQVDNLSSSLDNNKFQGYLDKLDSFAKTLSDFSDKYVKTGADEYIYGDAAGDATDGVIKNIGLFSGLNVKDLVFNKNAVNELNQEKLDYLATLQWKQDVTFDASKQDSGSSTKSVSFLEFFRDLKVGVSADKENNGFLQETQNSVKQSLKNSYEQLTKVDKDEEMLNLMKFQAAYTANAKIVSVIDEMLQTLLGLKR